MATSSRSNARKPGDFGSSPLAARLRLTILLATVAAFLLVPASQAAAANKLQVKIAGTSTGSVTSVGGWTKGGAPGEFEGEPPIECSGPPTSGTCESTFVNKGGPSEKFFEEEGGVRGIILKATPAAGAETVWKVEEGSPFGQSAFGCGGNECFVYAFTGGNAKVTVSFNLPVRFKLTVKKTGTGSGTVSANVSGSGGTEPEIKCGPACTTESAEYKQGKIVAVTHSSAAGSKFTGWSGACSGTGVVCEVTMSEAKEVTANFALIPKFKLTVKKTGTGSGTVTSSPSGINCGETCSAEYEEGVLVELNQSAAPGSEFTGWSGACSGTGSCKVTMSAAKEVTANFISLAKKYALAVTKSGAGSGTVTSSPAGINCGGTCSAEFEEGKVVTLSPSAAGGSEFREWSGACSGTGACEVTMSEAKSVNAFFSIERPVLTVEKSGAGTVSTKPKGIKCQTACGLAKARYYMNTEVEVAATEGISWSTGAGTCTGAATLCKVKMDEAHLLVASFPPPSKAIVNPKTLTLNKSGSNGQGTVKASGLTCEAACTETAVAYFGGTEGLKAKAAATVELKALAAFGSTFAGWSNCPTPEGAVCKASMNEGRTITATFTLKPSKLLTIKKSGNGSLSSKPKGIKCATACSEALAAMPEGTPVEIKTSEGVTWTTGAGTCTGSATVCTVTLGTNTELVAEFAPPSKAIVNPKTLTLNKAGTGYGTVKATGLTCEAPCTSTTASYFGGTEGLKAKAATIVTLTAIPQAGSQLTEWVNCPTPEGLVCKASMNEAHTITAKFDE